MRSTQLLVTLGVLFIASLYILRAQAQGGKAFGFTFPTENILITLLLTLIALLLGIALVRQIGLRVSATTASYLGTARAQTANGLISIVLYIVMAAAVASQTKLDLSGIALSGAVTGVIIGIAAQASLSNVVAGLVILFARPYQTGQFVTVRAAAFAGTEYSGEVGDITLFFTTILDGTQEIRVPNSSMISSVVVLRPQALDIYLPLQLPLARWEVLSTSGLVHQLSAALAPGRHVFATVERVDESVVQIGIRASVADEAERSILERALLQVLRAGPADTHTGPDRASDLHDV
jgi:mechanosensitive ion channel-like protein